MKTPGGWNDPVRRALWKPKLSALEHAEHDGADKGKGDIRGNNAQSADESHGERSLVHVAARCNAETSKSFPREKVSVAATRDLAAPHRMVKD